MEVVSGRVLRHLVGRATRRLLGSERRSGTDEGDSSPYFQGLISSALNKFVGNNPIWVSGHSATAGVIRDRCTYSTYRISQISIGFGSLTGEWEFLRAYGGPLTVSGPFSFSPSSIHGVAPDFREPLCR
jgi:hypothetical protein